MTPEAHDYLAREAGARVEIDKDNQQVLAPRVDLHLQVQEALIAQMADHVAKLVEETDFDPAAENRAAAAWLLAARAMALARALTTLLRAGFCTEVEPIARALSEVLRLIPLILDPKEEKVWDEWCSEKDWSRPKSLTRAEIEHQNREAAAMVKRGYKPPGRTHEENKSEYEASSKHVHPQREAILESWDERGRRFLPGPERSVVTQAVWVHFGDQWIKDACVTCGMVMTRLQPPQERGAFWEGVVETGLEKLAKVEQVAPLDPQHMQDVGGSLT